MNFYSDITENYDYIFPYKELQKDFTLSFLENNELNSTILDIGCATGNLTKELSKNVKSITGLDLDMKMISSAEADQSKSIKKENLKCRFICDSMLNINNYFQNDSLDCVISYGNTIVHLKNENEFEELFAKIRNILKPTGKLLLQIVNYDRIIENNISNLPTIENEHIKFERKYKRLDNNLIEFKTTLLVKKTEKIKNNSVRLFSLQPNTLKRILEENGFYNISFYSTFKKDAFYKDSIPLITAAKIKK